MSVIYKIENNINDTVYIGSTNNFKRRKSEHFCMLNNNKHHCLALQIAYNKLSKNVFSILEIEIIEDKYRWISEQWYINLNINNIYNTSLKVTDDILHDEIIILKQANSRRTFIAEDLKIVLKKLIKDTKLTRKEALSDSPITLGIFKDTINGYSNKTIIDNELEYLIKKYKGFQKVFTVKAMREVLIKLTNNPNLTREMALLNSTISINIFDKTVCGIANQKLLDDELINLIKKYKDRKTK